MASEKNKEVNNFLRGFCCNAFFYLLNREINKAVNRSMVKIGFTCNYSLHNP
jgi:hypothetical protein